MSRIAVPRTMGARPHKLLSRVVVPLIRGMVRRGMETHIDGFKARCEGPA